VVVVLVVVVLSNIAEYFPKSDFWIGLPILSNSRLVAKIMSDIETGLLAFCAARNAELITIFFMLPPEICRLLARNLTSISLLLGTCIQHQEMEN
jgi:hypothetical protein